MKRGRKMLSKYPLKMKPLTDEHCTKVMKTATTGKKIGTMIMHVPMQNNTTKKRTANYAFEDECARYFYNNARYFNTPVTLQILKYWISGLATFTTFLFCRQWLRIT